MNYTARIFHIILLFLLYPSQILPAERSETPETCTYTLGIWNTNAGKVTRTIRIEKRYSEITDDERDRLGTGCTVCSEDQVRIELHGLDPFSVCHVIANKVEAGLNDLIVRGEPIFSVSGYRPVQSRGALNEDGERKEFSNHAFGTALDINREQNGLYGNCHEWGPWCRLIQGGPWRPGKSEGSLTPGGAIVRKMKSLGFMWGGELQASQKDFMHFSLSGF